MCIYDIVCLWIKAVVVFSFFCSIVVIYKHTHIHGLQNDMINKTIAHTNRRIEHMFRLPLCGLSDGQRNVSSVRNRRNLTKHTCARNVWCGEFCRFRSFPTRPFYFHSCFIDKILRLRLHSLRACVFVCFQWSTHWKKLVSSPILLYTFTTGQHEHLTQTYTYMLRETEWKLYDTHRIRTLCQMHAVEMND